MTKWVKQLRDDRQGNTTKASSITPEHIEISELREKRQRIEKSDGWRVILRSQVLELHSINHGLAGARGIATMATQKATRWDTSLLADS